MTKTKVINLAAAWLCAHLCVTLILTVLLAGTLKYQDSSILQIFIVSKSLALIFSLSAVLLGLLGLRKRVSITVFAMLTDAALVFYFRDDSGLIGLAAGFLAMLIPMLVLSCTAIFSFNLTLRRFQCASSTAA